MQHCLIKCLEMYGEADNEHTSLFHVMLLFVFTPILLLILVTAMYENISHQCIHVSTCLFNQVIHVITALFYYRICVYVGNCLMIVQINLFILILLPPNLIVSIL